MASHVYFVIKKRVATSQMQLPPAAALKVTWHCALGTAVPSPGSLPARGEQREGQGAECPQGKEGTSSASQTLCRHSQEPLLSKQTTFKGFSSGTVQQPSSEPQKVRSESSIPLTCHNPAPGSPMEGLAEEQGRAAGRQVTECAPGNRHPQDPPQAGRADPHGLLVQGSPAAIQPQHWHCLRSGAKRPKMKQTP